jgi:hypothetical protein
MATAFVKPIAGALIRDPQTLTPLPEGGAEVTLDGEEGKFWRRRLTDGSVIASTPGIVQPENEAVKIEKGGRSK